MKVLKFKADNIYIFIPTELIDKYHSINNQQTQIFCSDSTYKLEVNTEELLMKIYNGEREKFEIISIPFKDDTDFSLKKSMTLI